jgi:hypothetical protein
MLTMQDVAVLIPALNEKLRIREVVTDALAVCPHVIVVDDGSDDGTSDCMAGLPITLIRHPQRLVNGARLRKRASQPTIRRIGNDFGDWGIAWACGFRLVDTQSGQRFYPRSVFTLADVAGEGFVFEAQMLISAARLANARLVSVPVETRYLHLEGGEFRQSHFRLVHDLVKITTHVIAQVLSYGHVLREYRNARRQAPVIHDPSGEFVTVPASS